MMRNSEVVRLVRDMTQEQLAQKSGIDSTTISKLESGRYVPTVEQLKKLCQALEWPGVELALLDTVDETEVEDLVRWLAWYPRRDAA